MAPPDNPSPPASDPLAGFTERSFGYDGTTRRVFVGGSGPAVIVIHEMPGITPEVAAFGRRLVDAGFSVWMPSLLGVPGKSIERALRNGLDGPRRAWRASSRPSRWTARARSSGGYDGWPPTPIRNAVGRASARSACA